MFTIPNNLRFFNIIKFEQIETQSHLEKISLKSPINRNCKDKKEWVFQLYYFCIVECNRLLMEKIAIFASGTGTNAQRIIEYFQTSSALHVAMVLSNNSSALVLERAQKLGVPVTVFSRDDFYNSTKIPDLLLLQGISYLVLAGFLWLLPDTLLKAYPGKILNIHPALLPKYGGKGMFGLNVHKAVIDAGEKESGITIHRVNEVYDEGEILFQAKCNIVPGETPESLAMKIHALEHKYYPSVIEEVVVGRRRE
jgi:phosphoribosylglycinamide formyltransferase 1